MTVDLDCNKMGKLSFFMSSCEDMINRLAKEKYDNLNSVNISLKKILIKLIHYYLLYSIYIIINGIFEVFL